MSAPRPSSMVFSDSGRQSPFRRQNSMSPATARGATPSQSPTKMTGAFSPIKTGSLSPEKSSPFVRRPSQIQHGAAAERPSSPFARPSSGLSVPSSPSRQASSASRYEQEEKDESESTPKRITPPAFSRDAVYTPSSPSPFDGPSAEIQPSAISALPSQAGLRPTAHRTVTGPSTTSTVKPHTYQQSPSKAAPAPLNFPISAPKGMTANTGPRVGMNNNGGSYNHVPPPLLHSMRESFEVFDSSNSGTVNPASVSSMLEQLGMDNSPSSVAAFFPSSNQQLNLARYLDTITSPLSMLSHTDELSAAFEAFDVDDSGQIDVAELRRALLETTPESGDMGLPRMDEGEIDSVLGEFASRRAFGAKGVNVAKGRGEVFRWREFMAGFTAAGTGGAGTGEVGVVA